MRTTCHSCAWLAIAAASCSSSGSIDQGAACELHITASVSDAISTVGIITLSSDASIDEGYVEFGLDNRYGARAPLNLQAPDYRTLLLGLRQGAQYQFRVVTRFGKRECVSDNSVITTGTAPEDVPRVSVLAEPGAEPTTGRGFVLTSTVSAAVNRDHEERGYVVIYDSDGELVWWVKLFIGSITAARMSWDGQSMYARDGNPSGDPGGNVVRVAMDGSNQQTLSIDTGHHDLAVTPDNGALFLTGHGRDGCDRVEKLSEEGELSVVYDVRDAFDDDFQARRDACHCNSIHYNERDDSITLSCLLPNAYIKLSHAGDLLWVLGGKDDESHFTGDVEWEAQHGHHMLTSDRILFFNNNGPGPETDGERPASLAIELALDLERMSATRVWSYAGGLWSQTLGDVQRLGNGTTLVTYSNDGVVHEVDDRATLMRQWLFPSPIGYLSHRVSLYGPPDVP